ncbi:DHS-like NAD/FAD-binding domain-containing protein [Earliella scabrosa]|nr:DHS-like NAD/FAD-binding domain-containing protein [Earliella scabrosa]
MSSPTAAQASTKDIDSFRAILTGAKRIVVLAGAGLSAASGIPTFRGNGGLWRKRDVLSLSTPAAFIDNPSRSWQFHHYLREITFKAEPNAAHLALARFAVPHLRRAVAPNSSFTLITQNIDGLDRRAMERVFSDLQLLSPLSPDADPAVVDQDEPILIEMHGLISGVACTSYDCRYREPRFDSPICPALAGTEALVDLPEPEPTANGARIQGAKRTPAEARAWAEARLAGTHVGPSIEPDIPAASLPRCSKCGALVRPDVVWFTEVPRQAETVMAIVDKADVCIVVGTSAVVHPAATFASRVKDNGGVVAVINIESGKLDHQADFVFLGPCEDLLPRLLATV